MTQYEIVEVHALPSFDPAKSVKHVLLSPANVVRVNRVIRTCGPVFTMCYFVGASLFPVLLLGPSDVAAYTAVIEVVLEVPSYIIAFLALRVDLLKLVVTSYDYWFFSSTTILFTVSFALVVRDVRAVLIASRWLGFQVPILIDALMIQSRPFVHAVMANVVLILVGLFAIGFNITDGLEDLDIVVSSRHSFSMRDLVVNTMVTMEILLLRITIRKYEATRRPKRIVRPEDRTSTSSLASTVTVTCVTIRSAVKLQAKCVSAAATHDAATGGPTSPALRPPQATAAHRTVQLRRTVSREVYDSSAIVAPWIVQHVRHPRFRIAHQITGYSAAGLTLMGCYVAWLGDRAPTVARAVSVGALLTTTAFVGVYVLVAHRRLLRTLCFSFDFVFVSLQISAAHACFCDMLYWRLAPCAVLACAWLWIHWVLTLDALTPAAKDWLGFQQRLEVGVIAVYFVGQVAACCAGLLWDWWEVQNRVLVSITLLGRRIDFTVLPFVASRMLTISVWTLRLLWRVCYESDPDKLLLLRGQVEFELEKERRAPPPAALTQVVPLADTSRTASIDTEFHPDKA